MSEDFGIEHVADHRFARVVGRGHAHQQELVRLACRVHEVDFLAHGAALEPDGQGQAVGVAVLGPELFHLQTAEILRRRAVDCIQITVRFLIFCYLLVNMF